MCLCTSFSRSDASGRTDREGSVEPHIPHATIWNSLKKGSPVDRRGRRRIGNGGVTSRRECIQSGATDRQSPRDGRLRPRARDGAASDVRYGLHADRRHARRETDRRPYLSVGRAVVARTRPARCRQGSRSVVGGCCGRGRTRYQRGRDGPRPVRRVRRGRPTSPSNGREGGGSSPTTICSRG